MEKDDLKIEDTDLYEMLDIPFTATIVEIKKAYRKKALQCHPDKNPDNPNAASLFHKLSKVLEILTDEAARRAYDRVLKGKKEAALRHKELDSKRKKLKEDLEARERQGGKYGSANYKSDDQKLREEIERLRTEGSKQVEEEVNYVLRKVKEEQSKERTWDSAQHRIKVTWNAVKGDDTNGGYNQDVLHKMLSKYGDVTALVVSAKKRGSALVEYSTERAAGMAVDLEKGLSENPLVLKWLNSPPSRNGESVNAQGSTIKETDFESLVLHKMRQAEERKRLIEQLQAEENNVS